MSQKGVIKIQGTTLLVLVAVLALAYLYFYTPTFSGLTTTQPPGLTQPPVAQPGFVNYNIGFTDQARNALDGSSVSLTTASNNVFHSNGRRLASVTTLYGDQSVATNGATNVNFPVYTTDSDILFVNIDTGTAEYPDPAQIKADNSAFTLCKWVPVTAATVPELVCELQISRLGIPNYNINPSISTLIMVSATPDDLAVTMSAPADQDSIGITAGTDVYVTWELTALTAAQAFDVGRIVVTSNQSASGTGAMFVNLEEITITASTNIVDMTTVSNMGTTLTQTVYSTQSDTNGVTILWKYYPKAPGDFATDFTQGLLIGRTSSDADSIRIKAHLKTYFPAATNGVTVTLSVRLISANHAIQTAVTDVITLGG